MTQGLESLKDRYPELVLEVTGRGLLRGLRMKDDPMPLRAALADRGLLVGTAGDNTLRLAPPLIVTDADVREAIDIIDQQFASMITEPAGLEDGAPLHRSLAAALGRASVDSR